MLRHLFVATCCVGLTLVVRADDAGTVVEIDGLKSTAPAGWKKGPSTAMRHAQFKIGKAAGEPEDTEIVVFVFGKGQGGSVEENLKRWKNMFDAPAREKAKVETFKVGAVPVTLLDLQGTYTFKPPGDPNAKGVDKPNFRMVSAVFESPNGPYFIRLLGPAKTVEAQKKPFESWIKAFK